MPGISPDQHRTVIPRWRTFGATLSLGELDSGTSHSRTDEDLEHLLHSRLLQWQTHRTVGHAADLVGAALSVRRPDFAADAAKFLRQQDQSVSPWVLEIARRALGHWDSGDTAGDVRPENAQTELRRQAGGYRQWLRIEPRDPISWVDLARVYATLGVRHQAARCMAVAVQLAHENRFVLRAAARLWIHLDDPERAHDVLAGVDGSRSDPWLLAAEIATCAAARRPQRLIRVARSMLGDRSRKGKQVSELAAAVATLELESGSARKSRRLFQQSLESPTENSIAQAAWASRRDPSIGFENRHLDHANAFEARSLRYLEAGKWEEVVRECQSWRIDQPFSSRPSVRGSYVSAVVLRDYETSERFAEWGLTVSPSNFILLNNLAFACLCAHKVDKARDVLRRVDSEQLGREARTVFLATSGLLAFRTGDVERGRLLYAEALTRAQKVEAEDQIAGLHALAATFYALEEARVGGAAGVVALKRAKRLLGRVSDPLFQVLESRVTEMLRGGNE